MNFRKLFAAGLAAVITLSCGCSVRPSNNAAWVTGEVENKENMTVTVDEFNRLYKFWLNEEQIPDDTAEEVEEKCAEKRRELLDYLINEKIVVEQSRLLGVTLDEAALNEAEELYNATIEQYIEKYGESVNVEVSGTMDVSVKQEAKSEAERLFDEALASCGMTRDDILISIRNSKLMEKLKEKLAEDKPVEFSAAEQEFKEIEESIEEMYKQSSIQYESYPYYAYYWIPEGARFIKHILIKFDSESIDEISRLRASGDNEGADALKQQAAESIKAKTDELLEKLDSGESFDELMAEFSEDPGKTEYPDGYMVVPNGEMYYEDFQRGAYELESVGEYKPIYSDVGCHIMLYANEAFVPEALKKDILDVIYQNLKADAAAAAYAESMEKWRDMYAYEIAYTAVNLEKPEEEDTPDTSAQ